MKFARTKTVTVRVTAKRHLETQALYLYFLTYLNHDTHFTKGEIVGTLGKH